MAGDGMVRKRINQIVQTEKNYFQIDGKTTHAPPMTETDILM